MMLAAIPPPAAVNSQAAVCNGTIMEFPHFSLRKVSCLNFF